MNLITYLKFLIIIFINPCLAPSTDDDDDDDDDDDNDTGGGLGFVATGISNAIGSVQGVAATIANIPSQATSPNVETTANTPQTLAIATTSTPTPTTISTTSSHSSTTSTAKPSSSTTSTAKPSSLTTSKAKASNTTTSVAKSSSAAASPGHHSSAKIGIGVGVPLGIIVVAIIGFLTLRHLRYKNDSRLRHHGVIAAAGLYPVNDESDDKTRETDRRNTTDVDNENEARGLEKDDVHEIQGTEIPAYSRELIGSPGMRRQELPSRPGSV